MPKYLPKPDRWRGFTLIELMLVVTIIGIMSGVLLSVINYNKHKRDAEDSIKRTNIEKLATALESYRTIEGKYPIDSNGDGNPNEDPYLQNYIKTGWLSDEPVGAIYRYYVAPGQDWISITSALATGKVLKYTSTLSRIIECNAGVAINDDSCSTSEQQTSPTTPPPSTPGPFQ